LAQDVRFEVEVAQFHVNIPAPTLWQPSNLEHSDDILMRFWNTELSHGVEFLVNMWKLNRTKYANEFSCEYLLRLANES